MKLARLAVALVVVLVLALAPFWLVVREDAGEPRPLSPPRVPEPAAARDEPRLAELVAPEPSRVAESAPAVEPAAAEPAPELSLFETRYRDATLRELVGARATLGLRYSERVSTVYAQLAAAGRYELLEGRPGDSFSVSGGKGVTADSPIRRLEVLPGGSTAKVYEIPRDEYPDVYESRDELAWLLVETRRRGDDVTRDKPAFVGR